MTSSSKPKVPPADGTPRATSPYARFIPREELSSFSAWQPSAIGDPTQPVPLRPAAPKEDPAAALVEQLKAARDGGYRDGYRDGLAALESFKATYAAQVSGQVGALVASLQAQFGELEQNLAQRIAGIALDIARQVVRDELTTQPKHVVAVAHEALGVLLVSARHVVIRVNPEDHALVAEGCTDALEARQARLLADAQVARGGCVVESDIGEVDAQVSARWERAAAAIGRSGDPFDDDDAGLGNGWIDDEGEGK